MPEMIGKLKSNPAKTYMNGVVHGLGGGVKKSRKMLKFPPSAPRKSSFTPMPFGLYFNNLCKEFAKSEIARIMENCTFIKNPAIFKCAKSLNPKCVFKKTSFIVYI